MTSIELLFVLGAGLFTLGVTIIKLSWEVEDIRTGIKTTVAIPLLYWILSIVCLLVPIVNAIFGLFVIMWALISVFSKQEESLLELQHDMLLYNNNYKIHSKKWLNKEHKKCKEFWRRLIDNSGIRF